MSDKTDFDKILSDNIDFKNRRIYFGSISDSFENDICWGTVEIVIRAIHKMSDTPSKAIELHISSHGGDALQMLRLYDVIQSCPCQVIFIGGGEISSAATWIMAGCDERWLYPNTRICIHDSPSIGTDEAPTKITDRRISDEEDERLQQLLNHLYARNSRMPVEFWDAIVRRDLWISAEEAIQLGLADKIIKPVKRGNLRRARIANLNKQVDKNEMKKLIKDLSNRVYKEKSLKIELSAPAEEFETLDHCDPYE